jgi:DnaK suppressor protein
MIKQEELQEIKQRLKEWEEDISTTASKPVQEISSEPIDVAQNETMIDMAMRRSEHSKKTLLEIKNALHKIERGTYGLCEESGENIDVNRLKANPIARYSIETQKYLEEISKKRKN